MGWPIKKIHTLSAGHIAPNVALCEAYQYLTENPENIVLAGSVSSYCEINILTELESKALLHSINNTWGFVPGEAAAFQSLCLPNTQLGAWQAEGYILKVNHAEERDYRPYSNDTPLGKGLSQACLAVLSDVEKNQGIANIFADFSGTASVMS